MSVDRKITQDIIETLEDGRKGFGEAAEKLADSNRSDFAPKFRELAEQRAGFSAELETMAASYGDDIDEDGSALAAVHRGWMALKDALAGSDPDGVLDVAAQGEDHALSEYEKALANSEISAGLRQVLQRQRDAVQAAHDEVKRLRDAV